MKAYEEVRPSYFATPPVNLIFALHVSLKQLLSHGMDHRFQTHITASNRFKDAVEAMGMKTVLSLFQF